MQVLTILLTSNFFYSLKDLCILRARVCVYVCVCACVFSEIYKIRLDIDPLFLTN